MWPGDHIYARRWTYLAFFCKANPIRIGRDESGRSCATAARLEQDVIAAIYAVADEYREGPRVVDAMEEHEQAEDSMERPSDLRHDAVSSVGQEMGQSGR